MDRAVMLSQATSSSAQNWRIFLRALADEVDSLAGTGERDDMLRGVGRRMARMMPLPTVASLTALEMEMNDALDAMGWGEVRLDLNQAERSLRVTHVGLPRIGSSGTPAGQWLSALLEGLYEGWFAQQPGSRSTLSARRAAGEGGPAIVMTYARHS